MVCAYAEEIAETRAAEWKTPALKKYGESACISGVCSGCNVRRTPAGFENICPESQDIGGETGLEEGRLVGREGGLGRHCCVGCENEAKDQIVGDQIDNDKMLTNSNDR